MIRGLEIILVVMLLCTTETKAIGDKVSMVVGDKTFTLTLYDNPTVTAFKSMLPMTVRMNELNGNEKYYYLPESLPVSANYIETINSGDVMLFGSNCLVLFYKTVKSSYSYTRIGHIDNVEGLEAALGSGVAVVTFKLVSSNTNVSANDVPTIRIYPVPANENLTVEGVFERLVLYDVNGNTVTTSNRSPLMLEGVNSGVYFLRIETGANNLIRKIIKK